MITLCSIFRDATSYVDRYFDQIEALKRSKEVRLVLAEGDSTDGSYDAIEEKLKPNDILVRIDHGGPKYGSVDNPHRWFLIAEVVRGVLDNVGDPGEAFIWVEADLVWKTDTMRTLLDDLAQVEAVAPMVLAQGTNRYYDTWGFRQNGAKFNAQPPYYQEDEGTFVKIDSCGSCFALSLQAYKSLGNWNGWWPFTAEGLLWLDPRVAVEHPE